MARIIMARIRIAGSAMGIMTGIMDMGIMADIWAVVILAVVILAAVILEGVLAWVPVIIDKGRPRRINISLDAGLLEAIDQETNRRGMTRSAFLSSAARREIKHS